MIGKLIKGLAPVFAIAAAAAVGGCDGDVHINDEKGVPLAELDTAGKTPTELVLAGPDTVIVSEGPSLAIKVSGDQQAVDALRFTLGDKTLGVMRAKGEWKSRGRATIQVTMPALEKLVIAGSGTVEAPRLAGKAEVTIAGSGTARTAQVAADALHVTIAGSGNYEAAGRAKSLELTVAGSGSARMNGLEADDVKVTVAGSGDAAFTSNGTVKASIMGSGDVSVTGNASCTISAMGSGKLHCNGVAEQPEQPEAPEPPTPPAAPDPPAPLQPPAG
ncbi:MAG: head GIN domain-containing protein [Tsuneonella sp.]